jgi:hypothetical protein
VSLAIPSHSQAKVSNLGLPARNVSNIGEDKVTKVVVRQTFAW